MPRRKRRKGPRWLVRLYALVLGVTLPPLVWGFVLEPGLVFVRQTRIEVPGWGGELDGLQVAVLTDLHVGAPHISVAKLRRVVAKTNDAKPDLVLLLGDFVIHGVVGGRFVEPERIAAELTALRPPLGTFAVLGNHDWWYDGERVRKALEAAGIPVLENSAVELKHRGATFWVAGLADLWTRRADVRGTLARIKNDRPVLLAMHNPDVFPDVPARVNLTIAGHTHGGQVNLPYFGRPMVPSKFGERYAAGHVIEGGRHLFVSTGVGTSIIPVRFRVVPEIAVLTLVDGG